MTDQIEQSQIDHSDLPEVPEAQPAGGSGGTSTTTVEDVTEAMKDVVDPELGINVVDLGLIYGITVDDTSTAIIDMTLTSAACPLTDVIEDQTRMALDGLDVGLRERRGRRRGGVRMGTKGTEVRGRSGASAAGPGVGSAVASRITTGPRSVL